jgi:type IV pilus assembly protein PilC
LFSARVPLSQLIELCRTLRHYLSAGLTLRDVFLQQAKRGPSAVRPVAGRISRELEQGAALDDALLRERQAFPPLFLAMASVGENSGNLPEVFHELERYYAMQLRLRRQFLIQSIWPLLRFGAAIFVVAGLIFILGLVADLRGAGDAPFDPLGLGVGAWPATRFLLVVAALLAGGFFLYLAITRGLRQKAAVDRFLLRWPVVGPCLQALALSRFCLALRLTLESGMSIVKAMRLTLRGTGNAAYEAATEPILDSIRGGEDLSVALARPPLFPIDFQNVMATAEEGGRLTEVLEHQADYYQDEAGRRLTILTQLASWGVWVLVAALIIFAIFRIALVYIGLIEQGTRGL